MLGLDAVNDFASWLCHNLDLERLFRCGLPVVVYITLCKSLGNGRHCIHVFGSQKAGEF